MMTETEATKLIKQAELTQPKLTKHFMQVVHDQDLSHAYLFSGFAGLGKLELAKTVAMRLFCKNVQPNGMPCGACNECVRIAKNEHPDVMLVEPEGQSIKVHQIRTLKQEFSKSAVEGNRKVFIINGADLMTNGAANSLLKFIEEPVGNVNSFLLTDDYHKILPTIQSRTQLVEFPKIDSQLLIKYAESKQLTKTALNLVLQLTSDVMFIDRLCEDNWLISMKQQVESWFSMLSKGYYQAFTLIQTNFLPLLRDREDQKVTIEMMCLIFRDVFNVKFKNTPASELAFGNIYDLISQMANHLSDNQLICIIDDILESAKKQQINVSFQNVLEVITLDCLNQIKE
ncbi:DNA polymerase III subunit delta' [Fructilactobacillus sanfranciscensis]|uniref:DNA polymerase III subunit delta' n=2 Tax=Fructilactobacillus sanfranciscensis TaxID=1625 RepID=UPI00111986DC|nr:DNA polymerase III subunit delta' [Fructilactobacillus sanfranciscensis]TNK95909.1 DNA polymerase III subunit delta' [Fructilactobacillus sanfranciscensis]